MNDWVIRYSSPSGRASVAICAAHDVAFDVARRLPESALLPVQSAVEARTLAAVFDVPAELTRIAEVSR